MLIITHSFKKAVGCTMDYIKSCHLLGELILKLLLCLPKLLQYMASSELVLMRGLKKKVFSNKSNLTRHLRLHVDEKNFECCVTLRVVF